MSIVRDIVIQQRPNARGHFTCPFPSQQCTEVFGDRNALLKHVLLCYSRALTAIRPPDPSPPLRCNIAPFARESEDTMETAAENAYLSIYAESSGSPWRSSPSPKPMVDKDVGIQEDTTISPPSSDIICTICLSRLSESSKEQMALACGHVYHRLCVQEWLRQAPVCPICRKEVER